MTGIIFFELHDVRSTVSTIRKVSVAEDSVKKLAEVTTVLLNHQMQVTEEGTFQLASVNRTDPWDMPYKMDLAPDVLTWRSAGPDGRWDTRDDIEVKLPLRASTPMARAINSTN